MNEQWKVNFIKDTYSYDYKKQHPSFFKELNRLENKYNKDLKDFNELNIAELLKVVNSYFALTSLLLMIDKYRKYVNVFEGQTVTELDWNNEILQAKTYKSMFTFDFITKREYEEYIEQIDKDHSDKAVYIKTIVMCAYEGLLGNQFEDIVKLRENDINGNEVSLASGRKVIISDLLISYLNKAKKINDIVSSSVFEKLNKDSMLRFSFPKKYKDEKDLYKKIANSFRMLYVRHFEQTNINYISFQTLERSSILEGVYNIISGCYDENDNVSLIGKDDIIDELSSFLKSRGIKDRPSSYLYKNKQNLLMIKKRI